MWRKNNFGQRIQCVNQLLLAKTSSATQNGLHNLHFRLACEPRFWRRPRNIDFLASTLRPKIWYRLPSHTWPWYQTFVIGIGQTAYTLRGQNFGIGLVTKLRVRPRSQLIQTSGLCLKAKTLASAWPLGQPLASTSAFLSRRPRPWP